MQADDFLTSLSNILFQRNAIHLVMLYSKQFYYPSGMKNIFKLEAAILYFLISIVMFNFLKSLLCFKEIDIHIFHILLFFRPLKIEKKGIFTLLKCM